jgi:hypothetical protein
MLLAVCLVGILGCGPGRLDETRTYNLADATEAPYMELPPQSKAQTIKVEFESSAAEVDVGLFRAADVPDPAMANFSKAMKAEVQKKSGSFSVDVPENTATRVIVANPKAKTDVKLHVTNR